MNNKGGVGEGEGEETDFVKEMRQEEKGVKKREKKKNREMKKKKKKRRKKKRKKRKKKRKKKRRRTTRERKRGTIKTQKRNWRSLPFPLRNFFHNPHNIPTKKFHQLSSMNILQGDSNFLFPAAWNKKLPNPQEIHTPIPTPASSPSNFSQKKRHQNHFKYYFFGCS